MKKFLFFVKSFLWLLLYQFLKKKYSIKVAKTKAEKEMVFKFRYKIYRVEFSNFFLDNKEVHEKMIYDEFDFLDNSIILYSGDINNITGTIRLTSWDKNKLPPRIKTKYHLTNEFIEICDKLSEVRYFQVAKSKRKSLLALSLISYLYQYCSSNTDFAPDVMLCDCSPGLVNRLLAIGCFPYTEEVISKEYDILQIPLAFNPFDLKYFKNTNGILYSLAKYYFKKFKNSVPKTIANARSRDFGSLIPRLSFSPSQEDLIRFRSNIMSAKFQKHFDLILSLMTKVIVLPIKKGIPVIRKDIVDFDMYLLLEGKLGIYLNDKLISELSPGILFGEMAFLDEKHKRYTDVKSLSDVKILVIPRNLFYNLENSNPELAIKLLYVLCDNLLEKLATTDKLINGSFQK